MLAIVSKPLQMPQSSFRGQVTTKDLMHTQYQRLDIDTKLQPAHAKLCIKQDR